MKLIKHLVTFLLGVLPTTLLGFVIVPIALLFCKKDTYDLPKLFWLWGNAEDGINGFSTVSHFTGDPSSFHSRYIWLASRNPVHNYKLSLGKDIDPSKVSTKKIIGDVQTSDIGHPGFLYQELTDGTWQLYWVKRYGSKCIRLNVGYKIFDKMKYGKIFKAQWVLSFSPFHPFREK